jgi:hypothetical protein
VGIGPAAVKDLIHLKHTGALGGFDRVIEIGAQQLSNYLLGDSETMADIHRAFGSNPAAINEIAWSESKAGVLEHMPDDAPASRVLWEAIGFKYAALDFDGHRDSIAIDLNRDAVPKTMRGAFQLLVNTGTTEHVANQDNAFKVMHDLICKGGVMMHELPAGGMMNHGLINYNMKFFWHLARENGYEVLALRMSSWETNPVPQNIIDNNQHFHGDNDFLKTTSTADFMITAIFRKVSDAPYVTPLDLPPAIMPKATQSLGTWEKIRRRIGGR